MATAPKTNTTPATATAGKSAAASAGKRTAPELTAATSAVPMPDRSKRYGNRSVYDFDSLTAVGMSFGVKGRLAKNMTSVVANANKKGIQPKKDASGNVIYKTKVIDAGGGQVSHVPTTEPETEVTKHFFCADVNPKTDPDGASVRIWRDK